MRGSVVNIHETKPFDAERPADVAAGGAADFRNARILLVDDSSTFRKMITAQLNADGFHNILAVADGVQGLEAVREWRPELIISDLIMPNMDGFEFCRAVRAEEGSADIPILVETGMGDTESRAAVFDAGATDLILKPINFRELLGRVRVHVERGRLIDHLSEFQRRMEQELVQARSMQESLLPSSEEVERLSSRYPLSLQSYYQASSGLGGDIWGAIPISDTRLLVYNADFSGHGVGAALNTFRLHSFIMSGNGPVDDPAAWLDHLNQFLCETLPVGQFLTMFAGVMDFGAERLDYAAACAPPVLLRNPVNGEKFAPIDCSGLPLGMTRSATFDNRSVAFNKGSALFLYSDALIETPDFTNPVFTVEKLCAFLDRRQQDTPWAETQQSVLKWLQLKTSERPSDDLTLVSLQHIGG